MKVKTADLTGCALDWAVAVCQGRTIRHDPMKIEHKSYWIWEETPNGKGGIVLSKSIYLKIGTQYSPSTNWAQGGTIIAEEGICVICPATKDFWDARNSNLSAVLAGEYFRGTTPLIAAMRCYVASKLGDEIELPKHLDNT